MGIFPSSKLKDGWCGSRADRRSQDTWGWQAFKYDDDDNDIIIGGSRPNAGGSSHDDGERNIDDDNNIQVPGDPASGQHGPRGFRGGHWPVRP